MGRNHHRQSTSTAARRAAGRRLALLAALPMLLVGCAGYRLGTTGLYHEHIRTIYLPVVRNDAWRPELGVQLTEALQREIETRTPFKVVSYPTADSTLDCRITTQTKRTVTEAKTDEPRAIENQISVHVRWTDRQGNPLMENRFLPPNEIAYAFAQSVDFVPEGGQSMATAQLAAIQKLAREIVNQMEIRW
ncbi:MAG: hypothetical protein KatS3mg111_1456 [Pirellulaceae bacterium]|nr:MAG: hypothetical protein KatS3mg111_1456 [Pirellulaceae bacterium]